MVSTRRHSLILLVLIACKGSDPPPTYLAMDSARLRIVTNSSPVWSAGEGWTVDSAPALVIHGNHPDSTPQLEKVEGAFRRSDGGLVVGDRGSSTIKYFDETGRLVRTVGRKGKGPGEFEYLAWVKAGGADSAFAYDIVNRHVTVVDPEGKESRWFIMRTPEVGYPPFEATCNRYGAMLLSGWGRGPRATEPRRLPVPVSLTRTDGSIGVLLGIFPGTEMAPRPGGSSPRRLGRWLRLGVGTTVAWVAPNETSEMLAYDLEGTLRMLVRTPGAELPVTGSDVEFVQRAVLDSLRTDPDRELERRAFAMSGPPSTLPALLYLVVDAVDHVWVQPHPRAADPYPAWRVYRPDGVLLGNERLPPGRILEVGADYVLVVGTDSDGAEVLQVWSLTRGVPPA
jgi:hypothetical protein